MRDLTWTVRGWSIRNPPAREVRSLLFVCKGNICRSPFAAAIAERLLDAVGRQDVRCTSAGIAPSREGVAPPEAIEAAAVHAIRLEGHLATALTDDLVAGHDAIVVMEPAQREFMRSRWPECRDRIFLLSLFWPDRSGPYERLHIPDPYGGTPEVFDRCYARIHESVTSLVCHLCSTSAAGF